MKSVSDFVTSYSSLNLSVTQSIIVGSI